MGQGESTAVLLTSQGVPWTRKRQAPETLPASCPGAGRGLVSGSKEPLPVDEDGKRRRETSCSACR